MRKAQPINCAVLKKGNILLAISEYMLIICYRIEPIMELNTTMTEATQQYTLGGFGARLVAAREALHLSQKDAAIRLHLNPTILEYLETENFQKAPPATFMRGYFRSYARLLNFTEDDISTALTQSGLDTKPSALVTPMLHAETSQINDRYVQWISTSVVIGLFVFVGIWWGFHSHSANSNNVATNAITAQPPQQVVIQQAAQQPTQQPSTTNIATASVTTTNNATTSTPTSQALPVPRQQSTMPIAPVANAPTQPVVSVAANTIPATTSQQPMATVPSQTASTETQPGAPLAAMPIPQPATPPGAVQPNLITPNANTPAVAVNGSTPTTPPGANSTITSTDAPNKKRSKQHHQQDNNVSGFAMELPEPGL